MLATQNSAEHIVLIPGFMCDARLFAPQTLALENRHVGHTVAIMRDETTIREMARHILATSPQHFALAGLSMGGIIALEIYRQAPQRVTHLGLLNTTPHADRSIAQRKVHIQRARDGELVTLLQDELKPRYLSPATSRETILPLITQMGQSLGADVFARQSIALMIRKSATPILQDITCPTLVLTGEDDTICPPALHVEMADTIDGAALRLVPNCGHLSTLEQPTLVTAALFEHWGLQPSEPIQFSINT